MSFLTALGTYLGARGDAKQRSYENSLEAQRLKQESDYNKAELALQQSEADQSKIANQAKLRAQGIDPTTGAYTPLALPKALQQTFPNNKGVAPATTDPKYWAGVAAHESAVAQAYRAAGRTDEADSHQANARDAALNATSLANSFYTANAKTQNEQAQTGLAQARAKAVATAQQTAKQIAAGHDAASIARANAQVQGAWNRAELSANTRQQLAQYGGETRMAIAQLAGAYRLTTTNAEDATRQAIAQFQQQEMNYRQATRPVSGLDVLPPGYNTAQQPEFMPPAPININLGQPGIPGGLGTLPPPPWAPPTGVAPVSTGGNKPATAQRAAANAAPNADPKVQQWVGFVHEALQSKRPSEIRAALMQQVHSGALTQAEANAIIKASSIGATPQGGGFGPEPPPLQRGSQAAPNPPRG